MTLRWSHRMNLFTKVFPCRTYSITSFSMNKNFDFNTDIAVRNFHCIQWRNYLEIWKSWSFEWHKSHEIDNFVTWLFITSCVLQEFLFFSRNRSPGSRCSHSTTSTVKDCSLWAFSEPFRKFLKTSKLVISSTSRPNLCGKAGMGEKPQRRVIIFYEFE